GDEFFAMPRNSVLSGYFQSIRFFAPYADRIKRDINLQRIATSHALEFGRTLKGGTNCAIQIRRGDYLNNPFFDVVDWCKYLPSAIDHVVKIANDVQFIAFSDDPDWCRDQPLLKNAIIHDPPRSGTADAMYLMGLCDHHIISNSSYGWWGAYLANS